MSTNKTQNYQLHSWLPEDEFHLTEINENFTALDTALKTEAQTAANGRTSLNTALSGQIGQLNTTLSGQISQLNTALQSEITTRTQQINTKANTSTVTALQNAVNARVQMVVGSYTGNSTVNGTTSQHIQLGFRPKAVFIGYDRGFVDHLSHPYGGLATAACNMGGALTLDGTGFTVVNVYDKDLRLNLDGITYCYAALY